MYFWPGCQSPVQMTCSGPSNSSPNDLKLDFFETVVDVGVFLYFEKKNILTFHAVGRNWLIPFSLDNLISKKIILTYTCLCPVGQYF